MKVVLRAIVILFGCAAFSGVAAAEIKTKIFKSGTNAKADEFGVRQYRIPHVTEGPNGLLVACVAAVAIVLAVCGAGSVAAQPMNVLVLQLDDAGYGDFGFTGHPFVETPNMDLLRNEGALCTQYYAPHPICSSSRGSLMTGRVPYRLGLYSFIHVTAEQHLHASEITASQIMRSAGYETALVGKWHLSNLAYSWKDKASQPTMDEYGFDYWFASDDNTHIIDKPEWWRNGKKLGKIKGLAANTVGQDAVRWLASQRDAAKPFFCMVNFYESHWLVAGPDDLVKKYEEHYPEGSKQRAHYSACIENVDREVGRIFQVLRDKGLWDNTIILLMSDHGPAKFGKGRAYDRNDGRATPYRGYKYGLWDGSVHVPGVVRWPGVTKAGQTIAEPMGSIDLVPTLAAMTDYSFPEDLAIDGADLLPALKGEAIKRSVPLTWHHYNAQLRDKESPQAMLREGKWCMVGRASNGKGGKVGRYYPSQTPILKENTIDRFALFDLSVDPEQRKDVSRAHPELAARLSSLLVDRHKALREEAPDWGHGRVLAARGKGGYGAWEKVALDGVAKSARQPDADPDNDGFDNYWEFAAGTDPVESKDVPQATMEGGLVRFRSIDRKGMRWVAQASSGGPSAPVEIVDRQLDTDGVFTVTVKLQGRIAGPVLVRPVRE